MTEHLRKALLAHWYNHGPKLLERVQMVLRGVAEISELHAIVAEASEVAGI